MSNQEWHEDQVIGDAAMRRLEKEERTLRAKAEAFDEIVALKKAAEARRDYDPHDFAMAIFGVLRRYREGKR